MSYYKLVPPRGRSDIAVDEVVFYGDDNEKKSVSVNAATELTDSEVGRLEDAGYRLVGANEPTQNSERIVGADVAGMSPVVGQSSTGEPMFSQVGMQDVQQSAAQDRASTSGGPESEIDQPHDEGVNS